VGCNITSSEIAAIKSMPAQSRGIGGQEELCCVRQTSEGNGKRRMGHKILNHLWVENRADDTSGNDIGNGGVSA